MLLKVGELAKRSGMTVRMLHHYDTIDLLKPSVRSDAGYRLYNLDDVSRLHAIQTLRQIGLSLHEIGSLLQEGQEPLPQVIQRQMAVLDIRSSKLPSYAPAWACRSPRLPTAARRTWKNGFPCWP